MSDELKAALDALIRDAVAHGIARSSGYSLDSEVAAARARVEALCRVPEGWRLVPALLSEVDRLRAEREAMKTECETYARLYGDMFANFDALRAERDALMEQRAELQRQAKAEAERFTLASGALREREAKMREALRNLLYWDNGKPEYEEARALLGWDDDAARAALGGGDA